MSKVLLTIGPFTIYWYSVLIVVAVIIGIEIASKYSYKTKIPLSAVNDMLLGTVISGIIGARTYYVIFNFDSYKDNLSNIFRIWNGGLAIYGAIIGGVLYIIYYAKKKKLSIISTLDMYTLSLLLGQAIGRWGNFFNQEAYGSITTKAALKAQFIPNFIIKNMYIKGEYRMPTFLYESLWCIIGVFFLWYIRRNLTYRKGRELSFYLIWYGLGRFVIEGMRSDSLYFNSLRVSQFVSIILVVIGILIILIDKYIRKYKMVKVTPGGNDINGRI